MTRSRSVGLTPSVLRWAREQSGLSAVDLAERLGVTEGEVRAWEEGSGRPTRGQFTRLTQVLRRPSALFFLPSPPHEEAIPAAFRSAPGLQDHRLTRTEIQEIRWARRVQALTSWIRRIGEESSVELPSHQVDTDATTAGERERDRSNITFAEQLQWQSASEAFRLWRSYLEGTRRLLVFQLSLGKDGVRGFSIWDDFAPLIAVNTAYHPTARVYTLFHELGHILLRQDSACFSFFDMDSALMTERWCEVFAAGVLLPRAAVKEAAHRYYSVTNVSPVDEPDLVRRMANRFNVSARALAIRLEQLELGTPRLYWRLVEELQSIDWNTARGGGGGGLTAPEKRIHQLGTVATAAVISAHDRGLVTARDLSRYLNLNSSDVGDLRIMLMGPGVDKIA